ncbi:hypothetical protein GC163_07335 [bacterium]|nr:hypothetical protein [bacterium]
MFRLLLAVSLWDGPVLWGHQHNHDATADAEHIARYHAGDPEAALLGWHWHCSLPESDPSESESPSHQPLSKVAVIATLTASCGSTTTVDFDHIVVFIGGAQWLSEVAADPGHTADFFTSQMLTHSPQQLLCRMVC